MAKITILKSGGRKDLEVTNDQATQVSRAVEEARKAGAVRIIKLPNVEFLTSDYKGAEFDLTNTKEDENVKRVREWHERRRAFAKKSPEDKTKQFMKLEFVIFKKACE